MGVVVGCREFRNNFEISIDLIRGDLFSQGNNY